MSQIIDSGGFGMPDQPYETGPATNYREYPPPTDLRDRVACTWVRQVGTVTRQPQPIIPDGCVDIIAVDEGPPHVAGPATRTQLVRLLPLSVVVGIRFRPGAARAVLKCSAGELLDSNPTCGRWTIGAHRCWSTSSGRRRRRRRSARRWNV